MTSIEQDGLQHFGTSKLDAKTLHPSLKRSVESIPEARPPTPKVLLFDLGHVFLDASYKIIHQSLEELSISAEKARLIFTTNKYNNFTRGKIDEHTLCDAIRVILNIPNLTDEQIREVHDRHIFGLVPGMVKLLEAVTQEYGNDNIVFVTDTCDWQTARQRQLVDLSSYRVIASNEVGMLKSDPENVDDQRNRRSFFLYVLGELGLQPQEALLIDDNPKNIATARGYGIQTIQFESEIQLETALRELNMLK